MRCLVRIAFASSTCDTRTKNYLHIQTDKVSSSARQIGHPYEILGEWRFGCYGKRSFPPNTHAKRKKGCDKKYLFDKRCGCSITSWSFLNERKVVCTQAKAIRYTCRDTCKRMSYQFHGSGHLLDALDVGHGVWRL